MTQTCRTQLAYICIRLMSMPCWCLLGMLAFILYKNIHLTPLQITIIIGLKPASSLLSPYWSQTIYHRPDRIVPNLIGANILRHLPLLFIPWMASPWFVIASFGLYMTLTRAAVPAWMELFKRSVPHEQRGTIVAYGTSIDYLGTALFAVVVGLILDHYPDIWQGLFSLAAGLGMVATAILLIHPLKRAPVTHPEQCPPRLSFSERIASPWRQVGRVLAQRKDFALFQLGFMFGGAGLMIMQPALPQFFVDTLQLSFTEMGVAIALCKGVGVALTSPLWTRLFHRSNIFQVSALVTLFASLFPFFLLATSLHIALLYIAYIFYGVMQAGSELSWHMSGLVFSREENSSPFSMTNILTVGLRGCIVPSLGASLLPFIQPLGIMLIGAFLCLFASSHFLFSSRHLATLSERQPG